MRTIEKEGGLTICFVEASVCFERDDKMGEGEGGVWYRRGVYITRCRRNGRRKSRGSKGVEF